MSKSSFVQPVTIRFTAELLQDLKGLAVLDEQTLADVVRAAATSYVEQRKNAPDFADQVAAAKERRVVTLSDLASI